MDGAQIGGLALLIVLALRKIEPGTPFGIKAGIIFLRLLWLAVIALVVAGIVATVLRG